MSKKKARPNYKKALELMAEDFACTLGEYAHVGEVPENLVKDYLEKAAGG